MLSYFASFHLQKLKYIYNKSRSKSGAWIFQGRQHKVKKDVHNIIKLRAVIIHSGILSERYRLNFLSSKNIQWRLLLSLSVKGESLAAQPLPILQ